MTFEKLCSAAALGLYLVAAPLSAAAQSAGADPERASPFVPPIRSCLEAPTADACGPVRAVVTECAADLHYQRCALLFDAADDVFDDQGAVERAQSALSQASAAIANMEFQDGDDAPDFVEASRADAERTMLRGDENLNAHSAPPLVVGD